MCDNVSRDDDSLVLQTRRRRRLNLTSHVAPDAHAFIDKMDIRLGANNNYQARNNSCLVYSNVQQLLDLQETLCDDSNGTALFSSENVGENYRKLALRAGWLFKADIIFKNITATSANISFDLKLNCARFIAHNARRFTTESAVDDLRAADAREVLRVDESIRHGLRQSSLDRQDNHFSYHNKLVEYAELDDLIKIYINHVMALLLNELHHTGGVYFLHEQTRMLLDNQIFVTRNRRRQLSYISENTDVVRLNLDLSGWLITTVEAYFDTYTPNALSYLHSIRPYLIHHMHTAIINYYGEPNLMVGEDDAALPAEEQRLNSISVVSKIHDKLEVSIYAKTANSLRLEVRYLNGSLRTLLRNQASGVGNQYADITALLSRLSRNASGRIARIIEVIPMEVREGMAGQNHVSVANYRDFLGAVSENARNRDVFERILEACLITGNITVERNPLPSDAFECQLLEALTQLEEDDYFFSSTIQRRANYFIRFSLTPRYMESLNAVASVFEIEGIE